MATRGLFSMALPKRVYGSERGKPANVEIPPQEAFRQPRFALPMPNHRFVKDQGYVVQAGLCLSDGKQALTVDRLRATVTQQELGT